MANTNSYPYPPCPADKPCPGAGGHYIPSDDYEEELARRTWIVVNTESERDMLCLLQRVPGKPVLVLNLDDDGTANPKCYLWNYKTKSWDELSITSFDGGEWIEY